MVEENKNAAVEAEFDWDAFENEDAGFSANRAELEAQYDKTLSTVAEKEVIDGIVISMNKREVVINIGYKSWYREFE